MSSSYLNIHGLPVPCSPETAAVLGPSKSFSHASVPSTEPTLQAGSVPVVAVAPPLAAFSERLIGLREVLSCKDSTAVLAPSGSDDAEVQAGKSLESRETRDVGGASPVKRARVFDDGALQVNNMPVQAAPAASADLDPVPCRNITRVTRPGTRKKKKRELPCKHGCDETDSGSPVPLKQDGEGVDSPSLPQTVARLAAPAPLRPAGSSQLDGPIVIDDSDCNEDDHEPQDAEVRLQSRTKACGLIVFQQVYTHAVADATAGWASI